MCVGLTDAGWSWIFFQAFHCIRRDWPLPFENTFVVGSLVDENYDARCRVHTAWRWAIPYMEQGS